MAFFKPADYDNVQAYGEFKPLTIGGHILVIRGITAKLSSTGKDMLEIFLDTAPTDSQPGYFKQQWDSDKRDQRKWGCIVYQLVLDDKGNTNRGLKTFITCVEKSNPGFAVQWGENFEKCFTGKLIGGIFRREEYLNQNNESKWAVKCFAFRSVDAIKEGVPAPEDKPLNGAKVSTNVPASSYMPTGYAAPAAPKFEELADDDELPF